MPLVPFGGLGERADASRPLRLALYIVLGIVFTVEWLAAAAGDGYAATSSLGLFPKSFTVIIEVSVLGLLVLMYPRVIGIRPLAMLLFAVLVGGGAVWVFSIMAGVPLFATVLAMRLYTRPVPMIIAGYLLGMRKTTAMVMVLRVLLLIALIQVPLAVVQFASSSLKAVERQTANDLVSGTLGGLSSGTLFFFLLSVAAVLAAFSVNSGALRAAWLILLLGIPPVLGEVKVAVVAVPLVGLPLLLFRQSKRPIRARLVAGIAVASLTLAFIAGYERLFDRSLADGISRSFIEMAPVGDARMTRPQALAYSLSVITESPMRILVGTGVGNATKNIVYGSSGQYYSFVTDRSLLSRILLEGGALSVVLIVIVVGLLFRMAHRMHKVAADPVERSIGLGFAMVLMAAIVSLPYDDTLVRAQFAFPFWLIAGFVWFRSSTSRANVSVRRI